MEQEQIIPKIRVGLVIDGYYFHRTSNYYAVEHRQHRHINIEGLKGFALAKIALIKGVDIDNCYIVSSQYFSGRYPSEEISSVTTRLVEERMVDENLRRNDVLPNYLPVEDGKEKGIDVLLATTALEMAIDLHLDVMVMITGDGDFQTLPDTLSKRGCKTMLICWDYDAAPKLDGSLSQTRTSRNLLERVHHSFEMYMIVEKGLQDNDPLILGLFGQKPKNKIVQQREQKAVLKQPRFLLGKIKSLHKREGTVEVQGRLIKFYRDDPELGLEFNSLKKEQVIKLRKETKGKDNRVFGFELLEIKT